MRARRIRNVVERCMRCRSPFEGEWDGHRCDLCTFAVCSNCLLCLPLQDLPPAWTCRACNAKREGRYVPLPDEPLVENLPLFLEVA